MLLIATVIIPNYTSEIFENNSMRIQSNISIVKFNQNNLVASTNWLDDTYLVSSESINTSENPDMVVDIDRNVHITWAETTDNFNRYIMYKCLPIDATWDDNPWNDYPTEVVSTDSNPSAVISSPTIDADESGNIHIAWKDGTDLNSEGDTYCDIFYKNKSSTGSWTDHYTEQVSIEDTEERCDRPTLVVDSDGTVHVVWISNDNSHIGEMHYNYKPLGGDWTHTDIIGSGFFDYDEPDLTVDESNKLHLVYNGESTGSSDDKDVYLKNKTYGGSWLSSTLVSDPSDEDSKGPKIGLSSEDPPTVHVTWYEEVPGRNDEIFYRECDPVWSLTEQVTDTTDFCCHPSIAVRPIVFSSYRIHIAYSQCVDPFSGEWHIHSKYKSVGDVWPTTYTLISDDATEMADSPVLFFEPYYFSYRLHCTWDDTTPYTGSGSDKDIVYKRTSPTVFIWFVRPDLWRGCAIAVENPEEFLQDNIPWWIDVHCKWLIFGKTHAEGVIDLLRPDETKIIKHDKFFGLGPAMIFAQADEAVIIAKAFIIGPFVIMQKKDQPGLS